MIIIHSFGMSAGGDIERSGRNLVNRPVTRLLEGERLYGILHGVSRTVRHTQN
jgi:hypothetical protein